MKCEKTFFTKYHQFVSWNRTGILFKNLLTFTVIMRDMRGDIGALLVLKKSVEPPFLDSLALRPSNSELS